MTAHKSEVILYLKTGWPLRDGVRCLIVSLFTSDDDGIFKLHYDCNLKSRDNGRVLFNVLFKKVICDSVLSTWIYWCFPSNPNHNEVQGIFEHPGIGLARNVLTPFVVNFCRCDRSWLHQRPNLQGVHWSTVALHRHSELVQIVLNGVVPRWT